MAKTPRTEALRLRSEDVWYLDQILFAENENDLDWQTMQDLCRRNPEFEQRFMAHHLPTYRRNKIGELVRLRYVDLGLDPDALPPELNSEGTGGG